MQTKGLKVRCEYPGEEDIENIILRSFRLYADNFLRQDIKTRYNEQDEWSLISGGKICTWK